MNTWWSLPARLLTAAWLAALFGGVSTMEPAKAAEGATPAPSIASLRERAAAGAADAQYDLGVAMVCRRGLARDPGEAARLLRGAAEQGHSGAQSVLGWMLMSGHGVQRNNALAAAWLRRAAEAGDTAAQNNLGVLYATGQGVAHDDKAAERWFRAAADQGAEMAAQNLAVLRGGGGSGPCDEQVWQLAPGIGSRRLPRRGVAQLKGGRLPGNRSEGAVGGSPSSLARFKMGPWRSIETGKCFLEPAHAQASDRPCDHHRDDRPGLRAVDGWLRPPPG